MRIWPTLGAAGLALTLQACGQSHAPAAKAGYRVYVTNEAAGSLTVIDGASGKVVGSAALGKRPRGIRVGPDGRSIYVALTGSPAGGPGVDEKHLPPPDKAADGIGVVDAASLRLTRTLRGVSDPEQLALSPDGTRLFVASEDASRLVMLNVASGAVMRSWDVGGEPEGVAVSPDGARVYVTSESDGMISVVDPAKAAVLARIKVGARPRGLAFSSDGRTLYATSETDGGVWRIDADANRVLSHTQLADPSLKPMAVVVSSRGDQLLVTTGRGGRVVILDAHTLALKGSLPVGARPWGAALSPDGSKLYTANGSSNDVSVVDVGSSHPAVAARIPSAGKPWGLAVGPIP